MRVMNGGSGESGRRSASSFLGALALGAVVALVSAGCVVTEGGDAPVSFRFVQWNMGHFDHGYGCLPQAKHSRVELWKPVIDSLEADIVGFAEYHPTLFDGRSFPEVLGDRFETVVEGSLRKYNCNAIWARKSVGRLLRTREVDFANASQPRYYLDAAFEIAGREVHVVATHLDWDLKGDPLRRERQIRELVAAFRDEPYVILCGDFNVNGGPQEWKAFEEAGWSLAVSSDPAKAVMTGRENHGRGDCAIDNIIVKGFSISEFGTADDAYVLSDHRPIFCTLTMR